MAAVQPHDVYSLPYDALAYNGHLKHENNMFHYVWNAGTLYIALQLV